MLIAHKALQTLKAKGVKEILTPGEKEEKSMKEKMQEGYLEVEDKIIEEIKKL